MLRTTSTQRGRMGFSPVREQYALYSLSAHHIFPLLKANNLLSRAVRTFEDYQGRRQVDADHFLPVVGSKSNVSSNQHVWTNWDKRLNPQLISSPEALKPLDEYVGRKTGRLFPRVGWRRIGTSWKFTRNYWKQQSMKGEDEWLERGITPKWRLVPRIADFNPQSRYAGKLEYVELPLSRLIWAIDAGKLNPNEVITLWHLREAHIIGAAEVVWPGIKLIDDKGIDAIRYPISLELQNGSPEAIKKIEAAGGSFVSAYLSLDGLYQTMHPEEYPTFMDQDLPDRAGLQNVALSDSARGYLCRYYENEAKYAHPEAGRRLSHYVRPPTDRDFPSTYEEFERVKHHQKWHLNQPGTGTVLPFVTHRSLEDAPQQPTILQE